MSIKLFTLLFAGMWGAVLMAPVLEAPIYLPFVINESASLPGPTSTPSSSATTTPTQTHNATPSPTALATPTPGDTPRTIEFSGYTWQVKKSESAKVGPGPNYFSDNAEDVFVDANGRLHMKIVARENRWYSTEVINTVSLGYGTYVFRLAESVESLNENVVLGLFTWDTAAPQFNYREIDIEVSRWGDLANDNGQYVVQPYTKSENILRFDIPADVNASTHSFNWQANQIEFSSVRGLDAGGASIIKQWTYTGADIPPAGGENARINLWQFQGASPSDGQEVEVIIDSFEFQPSNGAPEPTATPAPCTTPTIEYTSVPAYGTFDNLRGLVTCAEPAAHRVITYILVGRNWWVKPTFANPLTSISADGAWTTDITTGGLDHEATAITSFLLPEGYTPTWLSGPDPIPDELYQNSVAHVSVTRAPIANALGNQTWIGDDLFKVKGMNY